MMSVFLGLGSNEGNRMTNLQNALQEIEKRIGNICKISSVYQTAPWGFESKTEFLNMVVCLQTNLPIELILFQCKTIEQAAGRINSVEIIGYQNRPLDIDILFYDNRIVDTVKIKVPHPRMVERNFVLVPLAEIAPDFIHPVSNKTIKELLDDSNDVLSVLKIELPN